MDKKIIVKKICVVTASRSEYGLLRWVIDGIAKDADLQLQIIATGAHLSQEFGLTCQFIEEDGFAIDEKVDMQLSTTNVYSIAKSMGHCAIGMGDAFNRLRPDMVVVLGDRYELLPIVNTALVVRIPVAHISGGDVTEGAIDNEIRNAVSVMSTIHFPGIEDSANRLKRILGTDKNIYPCGEPGLDSFLNYRLYGRDELARQLNLDPTKSWMLVTFHSETKESLDYSLQMVYNTYEMMKLEDNVQFIITKANADFGGRQINAFWDSVQSDTIKVFTSLGQKRYMSIMRQVECVIGNSSSGIVEAPFLGVPVINIGNRQRGRHICKNVQCCQSTVDSIINALSQIDRHRIVDTFWGDGRASQRIIGHIKDYFYETE